MKDDAHGVTLALDGKPYTTMAYANGPGQNGLHNNMVGRQDLSHVNTSKWDVVKSCSKTITVP